MLARARVRVHAWVCVRARVCASMRGSACARARAKHPLTTGVHVLAGTHQLWRAPTVHTFHVRAGCVCANAPFADARVDRLVKASKASDGRTQESQKRSFHRTRVESPNSLLYD